VAKSKTQPAQRKKPAPPVTKKKAAAPAARHSPKARAKAPAKPIKVVARVVAPTKKRPAVAAPKVAPIVKAVKSALRKGVKAASHAATHAVGTVKTTMKNLVTTTAATKPSSPAIARSAVKGSPVKAGSNPSKLIVPTAPTLKPRNGKSAKSAKSASAAQPAIIPPPPQHVPGAKPGKNQAGLTTKELEVFRDLLLQKRRELVGDMRSMESEALQRSGENLSNLPMHMADMGTDNYEQEFTLGLMEKDRQLLREINQALSKIMDGRYGICEGTGKVISKARLEVQPWAKYSIEHARKLENRGVR
jgi:RNA polymerase-binding protein DksA